MKIATVSGFSAIWGNEMPPNILDLEKGRTVGGGEEAMLRTATGLAAAGHEVTLWWCGLPGEWRGVQFRTDKDALAAALVRERHDVIIGWSTILPFQFGKPGALRLFAQQLNDCWAPGNWSTVDAVVSPSRDHAMQLPKWGWKNKPWTVVHNGLDPELYGGPRYDPVCGGWVQSLELAPGSNWRSRPLNVGYWSSPDRGLHHVLEAWPEVVARLPQARLHVFYEIDRWLNTGAARSMGCYGDRARKMARELLPRAKVDPTITFHGAVTRKELAKTQLQCRVQCYPYQPIDYCEGFGGAVNQGIAAGCHVLLTPHDAFPSLYGDSVTWLPKDVMEMQKVLPSTIVKALTDETWSLARVEKAKPNRFKYTWESATREMLRAVKGEWDSEHPGALQP